MSHWNLLEIQLKLGHWEQDNFPNDIKNPWVNLLGVSEEVGELCHSYLKLHQKIRGSEQKHIEEGKDAVGDILIYLFNFCSKMGWNLEDCLKSAMDQVLGRDWISNPEIGIRPSPWGKRRDS